MASLRNIMNVDDDHADSHSLKKPKESVPRSSQHPESSASTTSYANPANLSITTSPSSSARGHKHSPPSHHLHSLAVETSSFPLGHSTTNGASDRRQSNTSTDSMDSPYGQDHGHGHGHAGGSYPGGPMRPFVSSGDVSVKLTPITGRVSRAKKGLAVHTCDLCRPPKLSHQPAELACQVPGCDKVFHRKDLLERHQQRHDQDGNVAKGAPRHSSGVPYGSGSPGRGPYGGSPPGTLQMPHAFNSPPTSTSSTTSASTQGMPIGSRGWPTTSKSTPHMRDTQDEFTMGGVKTEYMMNSVPNLAAAPSGVTAGYSEPLSGPSLGVLDPVPRVCISDVGGTSTVPWQDSSGIISSSSDCSYSTPSSDVSRGHLAPVRASSTDWTGSLGQTSVARDMQSPIMGNGNYPLPFGYGASPPQVYPPLYGDGPGVALSGYDEGLYSSHMTSTTVRSLSPQVAVGQSSETLVTTRSMLPADRVVNPLACGRQPETAFGLLTAHDLMPVSLTCEARSAIPAYLDVYWDKVHPMYPIIHRATFEDASGVDVAHLDVLQCAMAAVATQFLGHREHRVNGSQLHAYAWHKAMTFTQSPNWSMSTMHAILLCEYYARFRGRSKEAYRSSPQFNTLCQMVANSQHALQPAQAGCDISRRWKTWVRLESRRRLLAACFLLSVHGILYYEQPFTAVLGLDNFSPMMLSIPLSASTKFAWEAESVEIWASFEPAAMKLQTVGDALQESLTAATIDSMPPFDASLLLAAHALQLPRRQRHSEPDTLEDASCISTGEMFIPKLFPNSPGGYTYLALHYTPLHWLLSVSGDSWVFNKKIARASSFLEHQKKLVRWRNSGSAVAATVFAAKALKIFLNLGPSALEGHEVLLASQKRGSPWRDISDFWGVYVCALICWAFGHVGKPSGSRSSRGAAVGWIQTVAELEPGQLQTMAGWEDSQGVVGLVHDVLEKDCLGGRSILYADAVGVLRKLQEVDSWKWF
ncbi:Uncharacterized protein TPAR_01385 [Tolypocladium paradoxum]|uniref:C2H2-type domain-containing protein n=1 Tax=Tolypocladium paradoxum TaxID=94208 RepID=A0A2S4L7N1_9HYPO|nr:Uncharacterized protein TPAR_01385 [Tolypocladium paradoxum]